MELPGHRDWGTSQGHSTAWQSQLRAHTSQTPEHQTRAQSLTHQGGSRQGPAKSSPLRAGLNTPEPRVLAPLSGCADGGEGSASGEMLQVWGSGPSALGLQFRDLGSHYGNPQILQRGQEPVTALFSDENRGLQECGPWKTQEDESSRIPHCPSISVVLLPPLPSPRHQLN
ncbi:uncharacterized protein LOC115896430 [Rhinopithecus roxellana]|uniref:uncharacterized protein LOC115896430 n=1 Tax=Rhinopithecus roxellana TaxID=61622 RepID=UPI0012374FEB|nr:uncharacterized protein LOC115896430 [Rhinopithecus roxellana]